MPLNTMGHKYYQRGREAIADGRISDAIDVLKLSVINFKRDYDNLNLIKAINLLSIAYSLAGDDKGMATAINDGLKYCTQFGFRGAKNMFYNGLCDRFMALKDYENSLKYGLLTVENLEKFGSEFDNSPAAYMVGYLNLSYSYMKMGDTSNAELYLNKAADAAHENDIHIHDYTFNTMMCNIKHLAGDDDYVKTHTDQLLSIAKHDELTISDYEMDIELAVELFIDIEDYNDALKLTDTLFQSLLDAPNLSLRLAATKLYMKIYLACGDRDKYYDSCDLYITDDTAFRDAQTRKSLEIFKELTK